MTRLASLSASFVLICSVASPAADLEFRLTQIAPTPSGAVVGFMWPSDLNNRGQVSASSDVSGGEYHSFLWTPRSVVDVTRRISTTASFVEVRAINDRMDMVGGVIEPGRNKLAGFLHAHGRTVDISLRPDETAVFVYGINNRRQIIGESVDQNGDSQSFFWEHGTATPLSLLPGDAFASPSSLNERGLVVGASLSATGSTAVVWDHGEVMALPLPSAVTDSRATDINEKGQVTLNVGSNGDWRPAIWNDGHLRYLPLLYPHQTNGTVVALNRRGDAIGSTSHLDETLNQYVEVATLWRNGVGVDLTGAIAADDPRKPFVTLTLCMSINDRGEIVAGGWDTRATGIHFYLLTPSR